LEYVRILEDDITEIQQEHPNWIGVVADREQ
jgi:hypothetical protein